MYVVAERMRPSFMSDWKRLLLKWVSGVCSVGVWRGRSRDAVIKSVRALKDRSVLVSDNSHWLVVMRGVDLLYRMMDPGRQRIAYVASLRSCSEAVTSAEMFIHWVSRNLTDGVQVWCMCQIGWFTSTKISCISSNVRGCNASVDESEELTDSDELPEKEESDIWTCEVVEIHCSGRKGGADASSCEGCASVRAERLV